MNDQTDFIGKDPVTTSPGTTTVVEKTVTESTTERAGNPPRDVGSLLGMSGRFWITLTFAIGAISVTMQVVAVVIAVAPGEAVLSTLVNIFTTFIAIAGMAASTYLGQNQRPKSQ